MFWSNNLYPEANMNFQFYYPLVPHQYLPNAQLTPINTSDYMVDPNKNRQLSFILANTSTHLDQIAIKELIQNKATGETIAKNDGNPQQHELISPMTKKQPKDTAVLICQCSKSHCMKAYCICFKNGQACGSQCACVGCKNDMPDKAARNMETRTKAVMCTCSRSRCSKKYCQCYAAGSKCGDLCKCANCRN